MLDRTLVIATLLAFTSPAFAQNEALVWTGGIGIEERDGAPKDGTKLVFFVATGNFLSDVKVTVTDAAGKEIVNATSAGPWMILKLAPGSYDVSAEVAGQTQGGTIEVTEGNQEFAYMFRAQ